MKMSTKAENTIMMAGPEPPGIADTAGDSVVSESEIIIANDVDEIDTVMADLKRKKALRSDGAAASATSTTTLTPTLLSGDEKTALAMNISTAMSAPGAYDSDNIRRSTAQKTPSEGQFSEMARLRNTQKDRQRYQQSDRGLEGCIPDNDDFIDDMQNRMTGFDAKVTVQNADEDEKRKQKLRRRALIVMLALLIVLGVVVGIIFGMMGEKSNDEIDSLAVTLAPTAAPQLDFYSNDCVVTNVTAAEERTERYTQFRSTIDAIIPSMITAIDAPFSKERLALCWLSNMDGLVVKHDTSAGIVGEQREAFIQRYVLAVIYFHFTKTSALAGADTDLMETNWLASIHECEWNGVICDMNQKVQELILNNYGLAGHIPSELTLLTKLLALDMSVNSLTGEVPVEMYSLLPQLDALVLDTNQLSGAVLEDAAKLKNLAALRISNNFFTGTIPAAWSMERLRILDMKYNDFEGTFPDLSASTALGEKCKPVYL